MGDPKVTVILRILGIGKVAWFAVYICDNFWVTQYLHSECTTVWQYTKFCVIRGHWSFFCIIKMFFFCGENWLADLCKLELKKEIFYTLISRNFLEADDIILICTVLLRICIGKVAWFAVYIWNNNLTLIVLVLSLVI